MVEKLRGTCGIVPTMTLLPCRYMTEKLYLSMMLNPNLSHAYSVLNDSVIIVRRCYTPYPAWLESCILHANENF